MNSCLRAALVSALSAVPLAAQGGGLDLNPVIVRAADRDGEGVSAAEWEAFKAELAGEHALDGGAEGVLDRRLVLARLVSRQWRASGSGPLTVEEFAGLFDTLDSDANGSVAVSELASEIESIEQFFARAVPFRAADTDESSDVSRDEWMTLLASAATDEGTVSLVAAYDWIAAAQAAPPPENKDAITTGVFLLTLDAALDADYDGVLTLSDLDQVFAHLDRSRDGDVSKVELEGARAPATPSPRPPARTANLAGPLMPWQRSLEDALALSRSTGKPLLVCVNIDGESASEILAAYQYRDPEFVKLVEGFVPVLFSPDEHTPREHDDRGRRIPDPKFGRLITSEHTDNEPELYERYFGGQRVAPRHIGVSPEGEILFDVKLVNDLSIVDRALEKHGVFDGPGIGDPRAASEEELLASPDAGHRDHLESLFADGDFETRVRLARASLSPGRPTQHPEVLRMALLDSERDVRRAALETAVRNAEAVPTELLLPTLTVAEEAPELRDAFVAELGRMATGAEEESRRERAARLARVFNGLGQTSEVLDRGRWKLALEFAPRSTELPPSEDQLDAVTRRLSELERLMDERPADRELYVLFADSLMRLARIQLLTGGNPTYLFEDVRAAAALATSDEAPNGRALGYLAWSNFMLSDSSAVDYAARALPLLRKEPGSPLAAEVLKVFAQGRLSALYRTMSEGGDWPAEWVSDVRDAYEVLVEHPLVSETELVSYVQFLETVEAHALQGDVVRRALELFPGSTRLHASLRTQTLRDGGAHALETVYDELPTPGDETASFAWYSGLAALVAAERHVENRKVDEALGAYERSIERFRESVAQKPEYQASAYHYIALAFAGAARLHTDGGSLELAIEAIRQGLETSPATASVEDGLGNTPAATAGLLHKALVKEGRATEASALKEVLDQYGI